jgi:HEAT repeat protein
MGRFLRGILATAILTPAISVAGAAGEPSAPEPSAAAQEEIEHERVRAAVEAIFNDASSLKIDRAVIEGRLVALGPPAVEFIAPELSAPRTPNYPLACRALGRIKSEGARQALRAAVEEADQDASGLNRKKKLWACYGLAILGDPEAVDLLNAGKLKAAAVELFDQWPGLEVIGPLTAPACLPRLFAQAQKYAETPETARDLALVLHTIGRIGDPSTLRNVIPYLKNSSPEVRAAAARAIGRLGNDAGVAPLFDAIADPDPLPRASAAKSIEELKPAGRVKEIVARLEVESDTSVRMPLYRTLADLKGAAAIEILGKYWGRPEYLDRMWIANVTGSIRSPKGLAILRTALRDREVTVAVHATESIGAIGGAGATETLLATLPDPRWPVFQAALEPLLDQRDRRAGPRIADRLLKGYLGSRITDASRWTDVYILGDALADLRYADRLEEIRDAVKIQTDPTLVSYLNGLVRRLAALGENGADVEKWLAMSVDADDPAARRFAISRLGEIGGEDAIRGLVDLFPAAGVGDQVEILRALAAAPSPLAAPLIEHVLLDDAYDPAVKTPVRGMAAYAARRIGGPGLVEALRKSAERREGQDLPVLIYLAVVSGKDAVPTLRSVRVPRLRHFQILRGREQDVLDDMIRELGAGRPISSRDVRPEKNRIE